MGAQEVGYRSRQWLQARAERAGFGLVKPLSANDKRGMPWVRSLPSDFSAKAYRDAADSILRGEFCLFGNRAWKLGFPPAWNRDPASGVLAPLRFGKTLDYRDASLVGNIKYLWEPNRHLELVTLAQAWHLTRDECYAGGCADAAGFVVARMPLHAGTELDQQPGSCAADDQLVMRLAPARWGKCAAICADGRPSPKAMLAEGSTAALPFY